MIPKGITRKSHASTHILRPRFIMLSMIKHGMSGGSLVKIRNIRALSSTVIVLIIIAVIALAGVGTYIVLGQQTTPSSTNSDVVSCKVEYYTIWSVGIISNSSTRFTTSTQSSNSSYTTTTSITQSFGYATTTTVTYTGTLTGPLAEWNVQACTYTTTK